MKPVLILQHQQPENPGYLATWLQQHRIEYRVFNAAVTDFPSSMEPYSALAVMGGGMSVNDPLLSNRQAEVLILQSMMADRPVIGHCLGGQLMAHALGAEISVCAQPEIGWQPIDYAPVPETEAWFGASPTATVIHWHYDTFALPQGAQRVASSLACENQAFVYGKHLAMQFHIEIDRSKIAAWVAHDDPQWARARNQHATVQSREQILAGVDRLLDHHQATANCIYSKWLSTTCWAHHISV